MKHRLIGIVITIFILYCIVFPRQMALDVVSGLSLWYHNVLPTLLPFSILSYIIIQSNLYHAIFSKLNHSFCRNSKLNANLLYPFIFGYLFGFPIGAKLMADLYETGKITNHRLSEYTALCTQFGPAFIINYIGHAQLQDQIPSAWLLFSIYGPPFVLFVLTSMKDSLFVSDGKQTLLLQQKEPASRSYINFKIIDTGIINGFETMLRIAGYIVLFSILSNGLTQLSEQHGILSLIVTGLLEVTTGVNQLVLAKLPIRVVFSAICGLVSFGGLCGLFQVKAIMKHCPFVTATYVKTKLLCATLSVGIAILCTYIMK